MKKKVLISILILVISFTITFGTSGCKTGSSATLTVASKPNSLSVTIFKLPYWDKDGKFQEGDGDNYDMQIKKIEWLNSLGAITYDADGDLKTTEDQKEWTNYGEFANAGGMVSGFNITNKTTGSIMTLRYMDATLEIQYTVS